MKDCERAAGREASVTDKVVVLKAGPQNVHIENPENLNIVEKKRIT